MLSLSSDLNSNLTLVKYDVDETLFLATSDFEKVHSIWENYQEYIKESQVDSKKYEKSPETFFAKFIQDSPPSQADAIAFFENKSLLWNSPTGGVRFLQITLLITGIPRGIF